MASAACAALMAVCGAGAAGWPTSMWMTRAPSASRLAAAAITSITMKGGTSLRRDGVNSLFAASSIMIDPKSAETPAGTAPLLPYSTPKRRDYRPR